MSSRILFVHNEIFFIWCGKKNRFDSFIKFEEHRTSLCNRLYLGKRLCYKFWIFDHISLLLNLTFNLLTCFIIIFYLIYIGIFSWIWFRYFIGDSTDILFERWFHCDDLGKYFLGEKYKLFYPYPRCARFFFTGTSAKKNWESQLKVD